MNFENEVGSYGILREGGEEEDCCRVCRSGIEEGPLFMPCRCTGSIRYVHEFCLIEWLTRSKKTKCELCDTPLKFTKIYARTMPDHLPPTLLLKRFIQSIFSVILVILRALLVATCWLVLLPYTTIWILRSFLLSDSLLTGLATVTQTRTSYAIYGNELLQIIANSTLQLSPELKSQILNKVVDLPANSTMDERKALLIGLLARVKNGTDLLGNLSSMVNTETAEIFQAGEIEPWRRLFNHFARDVFSGQITASIVVVFFVVGFLLREWIIINAQFQPQPPVQLVVPVLEFPVIPPNWEDDHAWRSVDEDEDEEDWEEEEEEEDEEEDFSHDEGFGDDDEDDYEAYDSGTSFPESRKIIGSHASTSMASAINSANNSVASSSQSIPTSRRTRDERARQRDARRTGRNTNPKLRRASTTSPRADNRPIRSLPGEARPPLEEEPFRFNFDMPPHILPLDPLPQPRFQARAPLPQARVPVFPPPPPPPPQAVFPLAGPFINQPGPLLAPPENPFDPAGEEEEELDLINDFEGVLEAIGMKGPMLVLLQNMGLMNLLIGLCLGVALWIPLVVGRLLVVFNAVRIVSIPLRAVRSISDPIFDFIFYTIKFFVTTTFSSGYSILFWTTCPADFFLFQPFFDNFCQVTSPTQVVNNIATQATTITTKRATSTFFKATLIRIVETWSHMSYGEDTFHRGLCVALGYGGIFLAGMVYLNSTNTEYGVAVNRAIREGIKQQLTLMKVCIFVFVELIVFPFTCGVFLNLATLPVFPEATVATRIAFHQRAPLSACLICWLTGTLWMFCFSVAIDAIRDTFRPGSLWFIRDPASADFHPIREILERKSSTQARKIATSAVLYASVIFATVGLSILFIKYACVGVLPLRWTYKRTLALPLDLVVLRFVIPYALQLFDPRSLIRKTFLNWSKLTAHQLRLTQFVFGGPRDPTEEGTHVRRTWKARLMLKRADINLVEDINSEQHVISPRDVVFRPDGGFGRVPAVDGVRVVPGRRMLVRVNENGTALDADGVRVIFNQIAEINTIRPQDRYEVVYLPPNFKTRLGLFVYLLFFSGTLAGMTCILIPLLVGRYTFGLFTHALVHDVYSFVIGSFLLGGIALLVTSLGSIKLYRPKLGHFYIAFHTISAAITAIVLLPLLASMFFSLYIMLPLSNYFPSLYPALSTSANSTQSTLTSIPLMFASTDGMPTFFLLPSWTTGTVLLNVVYHIFCLRTTARNPWRVQLAFFKYTFDEVSWSLALKILNIHILWPLLWVSSSVIFAPGIVAWFDMTFISLEVVGLKLLYTTAAFSLTVLLSVVLGRASAKTWISKLREEEYLVEKKLQNYGEVVEKEREIPPLEAVNE